MAFPAKITPHWYHFLSLEKDLITISRFVEISKDNFSTYSIELLKLYLSVGSEIDVVLKVTCDHISKKRIPSGNIKDYRRILEGADYFRNLGHEIIYLDKYELSFQPWEAWLTQDDNKNPIWWNDYNRVKHHRHTDYSKANLENVLKSLSGLLAVLLHAYLIIKGNPKIIFRSTAPGDTELLNYR